MSFSFVKTQYRFVSYETRQLAGYIKETNEERDHILFLLEAAVCRFTVSTIHSTITHALYSPESKIILTLEWLLSREAPRQYMILSDLRSYQRLWDFFTSRFFLKDYSRTDLSRMANIFTTFSENLIMQALHACEPGKPLAYLNAILEQKRAETIRTLRQEEMFTNRVNGSLSVAIPSFRDPGFIEGSITEELFLRALQ